MNLLKREPVLLAVAVVVIVLGVDLEALTDTVNGIIDLIAVVAAAATARAKVSPLGGGDDG